ncbi:hypothetical protein [Pontibacter populi]|uniref:Lipoprotein n=1 Tax=Pontibacter populi TaxID=890055 RepID=A0ABV1RXT3_9BACT
MRKAKLFGLLVMPALFAVGCSDEQDVMPSATLGASSTSLATGSGAPSGAHYNLNIIGVPKDKTADMTGNNGGRIFVKEYGKTRIGLTPAPAGEGFMVLDANGTDSDGATFQLPKDVSSEWKVYARIPGNRGGSVTITTCADMVNTGDGVYVEAEITCESITMDRARYGKFTDVSGSLLFVTVLADVLVDGEVVLEAGTYPLFDEAMEDYFWEYDNNGLKLLQLRFYPN